MSDQPSDRGAPQDPAAVRAAERARLHRPFAPHRARVVSLVVSVPVVLGMAALAVFLPGVYGLADRVAFVVTGLLIGWFLLRQAGVRVLPDEQGLVVRNLVLTRRLEWAQVVSVRFGGGAPWAQLDLSDGETLSVMAVQRADGAFGEAEAQRLATLVELHSVPEPPPPTRG